MIWEDVRKTYPEQWVLIEVINAMTEGDEQMDVIGSFADDGDRAFKRYSELHKLHKEREYYIYNTSHDTLDIGVKKWLIPNKEIFINKLVKIRDADVILISITSEENRNVLWTMYQPLQCIEDEIDADKKENPITNRYEKINAIRRSHSFKRYQISEITIQQQKMTFTSSETSPINDNNYKGYMRLQHFIENGLDIACWDDVNLSDLVIVAYIQKSTDEFPQIDLAKELEITLKVSKEFNEVLIKQPMLLEFGEKQKGIRYSFYDFINKKDRFFYIDKLNHYDIWEEVKKSFKDESLQGFTEESRDQFEKQYMTNLELICPNGMDLAMIEYETEDGLQLNFYAKEYLDARPAYGNSSGFILFKPDKRLGINGYESRFCMLNSIEKTFYGSISVELFSWYQDLPEEIIKI